MSEKIWKKYNINQTIRIRLSKKGLDYLISDTKNTFEKHGITQYSQSIISSYKEAHKKNNGWMEFQMWEFLSTFKECFEGAGQTAGKHYFLEEYNFFIDENS